MPSNSSQHGSSSPQADIVVGSLQWKLKLLGDIRLTNWTTWNHRFTAYLRWIPKGTQYLEETFVKDEEWDANTDQIIRDSLVRLSSKLGQLQQELQQKDYAFAVHRHIRAFLMANTRARLHALYRLLDELQLEEYDVPKLVRDITSIEEECHALGVRIPDSYLACTFRDKFANFAVYADLVNRTRHDTYQQTVEAFTCRQEMLIRYGPSTFPPYNVAAREVAIKFALSRLLREAQRLLNL